MFQVLVGDVKVLPVLLKKLLDPEFMFSDQICTILSNLTRHEKTCKTVFKVIDLEIIPGSGSVSWVAQFVDQLIRTKELLVESGS